MDDNVNYVKKIIEDNKNNIAFVLGNGINLYSGIPGCKWDSLLTKLWNSNMINNKDKLPNDLSLIEFYDILEKNNRAKQYDKIIKSMSSVPYPIISNDTSSFDNEKYMRDYYQSDNAKEIFVDLQNQLCQMLKGWKSTSIHKSIVKKIESLNVPLLTTNFDNTLSDCINMSKNNYRELPFEGRDKLHWNYYYSRKPLLAPTSGFGIWKIHGSIDYPQSIRFGLSHYMEAVYEEMNLFLGINDFSSNKDIPNASLDGKVESSWKGANTWLDIFYNRSLMFIGLKLDQQEVFLRWLLIQKAIYYTMYKNKATKADQGWYITTCDKTDLDSFFFRQVGLEVIKVPDYNSIYSNILNI